MDSGNFYSEEIKRFRNKRAEELKLELRLRKEMLDEYIVKLCGHSVDDPYFSVNNRYVWTHWGFVPWRVRDRLARLGEL